MNFLRPLITLRKSSGGDLDSLAEMLGVLSDWLLFLSIAVAIIVILVGAYYYIFSFGNTDRANKGKTVIYWAVIGLIVVLLAKIIISFTLSFIGANKTVPPPSEVPLFNAPPAQPTR